MKTVGIVGGLGPESTVDYYKSIITKYKSVTNDSHNPTIIIVSVDLEEVLFYESTKNYNKLIQLLLNAVDKLKKAGADFAAIASNTPHIVFDELNSLSSMELLSIVDAVSSNISQRELKRVLLTGTFFTMKENFYKKTADKCGVEIIVPAKADQEEIHNVIFPELEDGIIVPSKKKKYIEIVEKIKDTRNIDGVILGCTELPLMISQEDLSMEVINTSEIHVNQIVNKIVE